MTMSNRCEPVKFLIGSASAALQVEGGEVDTNWHDWARVPGNVLDGSTPARATDHWNRWREDNALMSELDMQIARIGLEWARKIGRASCRERVGMAGAGGWRRGKCRD